MDITMNMVFQFLKKIKKLKNNYNWIIQINICISRFLNRNTMVNILKYFEEIKLANHIVKNMIYHEKYNKTKVETYGDILWFFIYNTDQKSLIRNGCLRGPIRNSNLFSDSYDFYDKETYSCLHTIDSKINKKLFKYLISYNSKCKHENKNNVCEISMTLKCDQSLLTMIAKKMIPIFVKITEELTKKTLEKQKYDTLINSIDNQENNKTIKKLTNEIRNENENRIIQKQIFYKKLEQMFSHTILKNDVKKLQNEIDKLNNQIFNMSVFFCSVHKFDIIEKLLKKHNINLFSDINNYTVCNISPSAPIIEATLIDQKFNTGNTDNTDNIVCCTAVIIE